MSIFRFFFFFFSYSWNIKCFTFFQIVQVKFCTRPHQLHWYVLLCARCRAHKVILMHLVKFPFCFPSQYKEIWKKNLAIYWKSLAKTLFSRHPFMYLGLSCCLIFLCYVLISVTLVLCIMSWMKCAWPLLLLTLSLNHAQRGKPTSTVWGEFICIWKNCHQQQMFLM